MFPLCESLTGDRSWIGRRLRYLTGSQFCSVLAVTLFCWFLVPLCCSEVLPKRQPHRVAARDVSYWTIQSCGLLFWIWWFASLLPAICLPGRPLVLGFLMSPAGKQLLSSAVYYCRKRRVNESDRGKKICVLLKLAAGLKTWSYGFPMWFAFLWKLNNLR